MNEHAATASSPPVVPAHQSNRAFQEKIEEARKVCNKTNPEYSETITLIICTRVKSPYTLTKVVNQCLDNWPNLIINVTKDTNHAKFSFTGKEKAYSFLKAPETMSLQLYITQNSIPPPPICLHQTPLWYSAKEITTLFFNSSTTIITNTLN